MSVNTKKKVSKTQLRTILLEAAKTGMGIHSNFECAFVYVRIVVAHFYNECARAAPGVHARGLSR